MKIDIEVLLGDDVVATESFEKGTKLDFIYDKLTVRYGQIVAFRIIVPPVFDRNEKVK